MSTNRGTPVWQVATSIQETPSVCRIPRRPRAIYGSSSGIEGAKNLGLQHGALLRRSSLKSEDVYWVPWSKASNGFTSLFGELHGLTDPSAPARLEVLPYVVADGRRRPESTGSVYAPESAVGGNLGFDLKYGLSSDFTLDLTANPDFSQVEADPAVVNLTAFESFFPERRPFFVEGGALFDQRVIRGWMFYSRRISRSPQGWSSPPDGGTVEIPDASTIVSAAKVTGKSAGGGSN